MENRAVLLQSLAIWKERSIESHSSSTSSKDQQLAE
jgi:hypothetical protein